ncbi:MAG TPA: DsbA family protein [Baekduia sp.]|uniref:2-hydroxychromene-2-carboxylate isomerase n=1 Tax=Baekduia sp. TaxID=2600305 RepID=UPI002D775DAD|nr:DsbA family protein [Baekduia sp.]HET6505279.1 DsbA family protein [Baekduia sp.]
MTTLYYDLASPYAYLAFMRAADVLGAPPTLRPVLAGAIFAHRGWGSWAHMETRAENVAEVERRAAAYGLPPVTWPPSWPPNSLNAMRAVVWARREHGDGAAEAFSRVAFRLAFAEDQDLGDLAVLERAAAEAGLGDGVRDGLADPAVKAALREATESAIARGVRGVPSVETGDGRILFGDDRLAEAVA